MSRHCSVLGISLARGATLSEQKHVDVSSVVPGLMEEVLPRTHTHTHTHRPSVAQRVECRRQFLEDPCEPGGWNVPLRKRAGSQISFSLTCVLS